MSRPKILDLYCGGGGAAAGYHKAGFDVLGVDIAPQPNYPFEFVQRDALDYLELLLTPELNELRDFAAVHASPPCQIHVKGLRAMNETIGRTHSHRDWIAATRDLLVELGLPYVIENVHGAPLVDAVQLCGSSFGLPIRRHRLFESSVFLMVPPCNHAWQTEKKYWNGDRSVRNGDGTRSYTGHDKLSSVVQIYGHAGGRDEWPVALDIDWMTDLEMIEAIPPAYTEFIGTQLMAHLKATVAA